MSSIQVPRPVVPFGPKGVAENVATANYLREAARNIEFARCMGRNLTATVMTLLHDAANAVEVSEPVAEVQR